MKQRHEKARSSAKAINFGVAGGMGPERIRAYAKYEFGVELTLDKARQHRELLITTIYPELTLYLANHDAIAAKLQAPVAEVRAELGDTPLASISKILAGDPKKADGKPYQKPFVSQIWSSLAGLNRNTAFAADLRDRKPSKQLADQLCRGRALLYAEAGERIQGI